MRDILLTVAASTPLLEIAVADRTALTSVITIPALTVAVVSTVVLSGTVVGEAI